jgi:long-chain acyl-CoA synthetase
MHYAQLKAAWAELTAEGAPFEFVTLPVRGVPVRAYKQALNSARELWLSTADFAERDYLVYGDERITYGQARRVTTSVAAWLVAHGVARGDRIAIAMRNYPEWLLIYWAALSIGVAVVGMNAWWVPDEIAYALKDSQPKVVFADAERLQRILTIEDAGARQILVAVRTLGRPIGVRDWCEVAGHEDPMPEVVVEPDDDACIFYTSGTTGFPKGAQLTHRGCINNMMNMVFAGQVSALAAAKAAGEDILDSAPPPPPAALITTPLFHVTANNCGSHPVTAAGGKLVLMYRWDAGKALRLIEQEKVTSMSGVPTMSRELINHPDFPAADLSSLTSLGGGGAQLPPDLVLKIDTAVATARPITGYGLTETCGIVTCIQADFFVDKPDSAGPPMPTFEVCVVDDEGGALQPGEVGELWVRGSTVIKGYLNRPEATAETITDGWLHTGDVARVDEDGFLYIVDRKKEMVLRGGENVYCAEVEAALYRHPAVAECSVFGAPDERLGEVVAAAVFLHPQERATAQDLQDHCAKFIAAYKRPEFLWILDEPLPRGATGKIVKRELRDRLVPTLRT